jgi:hypothetical protein
MAYSDQTLKELGELFLEVAHGEDREAIVTAVQKKKPDFKAPDIEIKRLEKKVEERFEEDKQEKERMKSLARMESQKQKLLDSQKYSSEDVEKIEAYMQERGIADYDDGATLYGARHAPAAATSEIKTSRWEMPSFKGLMEDPNRWASNEAHKVIAEFRGNRR